ncbi:putative feruloyl esterase b protein [Eutypa lata UCREL1]|uniref:Carboxylic ester hydrolase n=1 Tax=Eutypa lata (strain UCR-EL1) TaxID=1287681 RepID=M7SGM9_EUTLA|nr:putative feruloyl esterase b protein [Eutypa lata UCREL1]
MDRENISNRKRRHRWLLHTSVITTKQLAPLFYGEEVDKSYFIGCSLGGRQGIKAAEMFPEDFDGILAGAPAVDFNSLYSWRASFFPITGAAGSENFISADTWTTTIHDEVLKQCDGIDGVADGIIEDPTLCLFEPNTLLCGTYDPSVACLNSAQIQVVKAIFNDYTWPNGSLLFPAMQPGSEVQAANGLYSGAPFSYSQDWFRFAILEDPDWDPSTYTVSDALLAIEKDPGSIRTWPLSLSSFESRGGKILTYHGLQDQQITSYNSIRFYEHLASQMKYSSEQMDNFYRFFRIPAALVAWVENGSAPETVTGTKFVDDVVAQGVAYRHSHCRYPTRSTYLGSEQDPLEERSWACELP